MSCISTDTVCSVMQGHEWERSAASFLYFNVAHMFGHYVFAQNILELARSSTHCWKDWIFRL